MNLEEVNGYVVIDSLFISLMWTGAGEGGQHTNLAAVLSQILNNFFQFLVLTWTLDISSICEKLCRPPTVRDLKLKEIYHEIQ